MTSDFSIQWQKMLNGEIYEATHPEFLERLQKTRVQIWQFNNSHPDMTDTRETLLRSLLGYVGKNIHINQPFRCDFGCNIHIGDNFFANFNLTILDEARVSIGNNVFIGPNVSIYTACHPLDPALRNTGVEWAEPITIRDNVWIGGNVTILPGVTIGDNAVIGAGSVVTHDIPDNSVAAGNPARIIKEISTHNPKL
ncbi:MAG: sugar O-acetyltransferase [Muribaculum sp.]|nr:sugar O-acetyltransferase [Muribaculum sp.]